MSKKLYLDTEFNGFGGEIISIALYEPVSTACLYEVIDYRGKTIHPWVQEHVIPKLNKEGISFYGAMIQVKSFLSLYPDATIYADWPEDFIHLLRFTCMDMGVKLVKSLSLELITTPDTHISKIPHNALEDAVALHLNHQEMLK